MHKLNILILGPSSFKSTFEEIKPYLKFNLSSNEKDSVADRINKFDIILCHQEYFDDQSEWILIAHQIPLGAIKIEKVMRSA